MSLGKIVTFYSFKGGVGRSMALANTAATLAISNERVCIVDWDLEAPGIDLYFQQLQRSEPNETGGLLRLLETRSETWMDFTYKVNVLGHDLNLLPSGRADDAPAYTKRLQALNWENYYRTGGGDYLESLIESWREQFDYVFVDSRTGLTDSGGICTIQLPDILVIVFTANRQSLEGAKEVAEKARYHRQRMDYAKMDLTVIPLVSRWDGAEETDEGTDWLKRIDDQVSEYFGRWAGPGVSRKIILEELRVPHVALFSFGEKLAVLSHSVTDQFLPGKAYVRLAAILRTMDWGSSDDAVKQIADLVTKAQRATTRLSGASRYRRIFLSAVSSEFESYRRLLTQDLTRSSVDVAVQEDFITSGGLTLEKLDDYIRACDGVVHLIGKASGSGPGPIAVQALLHRYPDFAERLPPLGENLRQPDPGFSYTQWEAYLAIYHGRPTFAYRPEDFEPASAAASGKSASSATAEQEKAQQAHYQRIRDLGRDSGRFSNQERLSSAVLRDLVEILPQLEPGIDVPPTKLRHTAEVLLGRDKELTVLDEAWNEGRNVVVVHGKGGEGKTSLVASWMAELALKRWRGAECVFDWSFYSQGTKDQSAATAEVFITTALAHFGDRDPNAGGPDERGTRLARLVGARRCLLVLDGVEPLQYPPGPQHGQLKDPGMAALLRGLAVQNTGLCIVTTSERVDEIKQYYGKTAVDHALDFLSPAAGAALLHHAGARRAGPATIEATDKELQQASVEMHGHALTLFLVGQYLKLTEDGDIRRRDRIKLAEADAEYRSDATRPYGLAFKAIQAYETWFAAGDDAAKRQLAILRLLGLFDRPASAPSLTALRAGPIPGLNEAVAGASAKEWKIALGRLQEINLVAIGEDGAVDCHPLIREYFAAQLKAKQPEAFRAAHSRLFDHLCESTEHQPDTLAGLQPLYQAVVHGCLAGRQQEACDNVYFDRILRGTGDDGFYSTRNLGAVGADLRAVAAFFEEPWSRLWPTLSAPTQAWLLIEAATRLRALGRLTEAVEPMRVSLKMAAGMNGWKQAAIGAANLSQLDVTLGRLDEAVADGRRAIDFADRSADAFERMSKRATAADALHQAGRHAEAATLFAEAERMQAERQPQFPLLYSLQGFRYLDLLLAPAERVAWQSVLQRPNTQSITNRADQHDRDRAAAACAEAERRAPQTLDWVTLQNWLLDIALDHLTLARARLYHALLSAAPVTDSARLAPQISTAIAKLREANQIHELPKGLLTAALHAGTLAGQPEEARRLLDEAQLIAERGPMPLYLADVHLHRARLFRDRDEFARARALIEKHGYWRRKEELEDAEAALAPE